MQKIRPLNRSSVAAALWIASLAAGADELTDRAAQFINTGEHRQAYELLAPVADERAGDPDFDYLLGVAAIDAGYPQQAIYALERVLDARPDSAPARAHLARAFYLVGENEAAQEQFATVQRAPAVPDEAQRAIDRYLTAIDARFATTRPRWQPYAQISSGYDTNVNSATDDGTVAIPRIGGSVTLDPNALEQNSMFIHPEVGFTYSAPIGARADMYAGADVGYRLVTETDDFSQAIGNANLGIRTRHGADQFRFGLTGQHILVDGNTADDADRTVASGTVQWLRGVTSRDQISAFAQGGIVRHTEQDQRDVDRYLGGVGWARVLNSGQRAAIAGSVFYGVEDKLADSADSVERDFYGLRFGGQFAINDRWTAYGAAAWQHSDYDAVNLLFGETQDDDFVRISAAAETRLLANLSLRPELRYSANYSNFGTDDFERFEFVVTARYEF